MRRAQRRSIPEGESTGPVLVQARARPGCQGGRGAPAAAAGGYTTAGVTTGCPACWPDGSSHAAVLSTRLLGPATRGAWPGPRSPHGRSRTGHHRLVSENPSHDRARAVHDEMAGLQHHADEAMLSLRARRRARRRRLAVRRSLRVVLILVLLLAVGVVAFDVGGVRSAMVDVVRHDVIDPSQGR